MDVQIRSRRMESSLRDDASCGRWLAPALLGSWSCDLHARVGILRSLAENSAPPFEEISPSRSGISWTHVSGRSPMAHLAGDGWPGMRFSRLRQ